MRTSLREECGHMETILSSVDNLKLLANEIASRVNNKLNNSLYFLFY